MGSDILARLTGGLGTGLNAFQDINALLSRDPTALNVLMQNRAAALQDPTMRAQIAQSPFQGGLYGLPSVAQPVDLAPGGPSAPTQQLRPQLPPLGQEASTQQAILGAEQQLVQQPGGAELAARAALKIPQPYDANTLAGLSAEIEQQKLLHPGLQFRVDPKTLRILPATAPAGTPGTFDPDELQKRIKATITAAMAATGQGAPTPAPTGDVAPPATPPAPTDTPPPATAQPAADQPVNLPPGFVPFPTVDTRSAGGGRADPPKAFVDEADKANADPAVRAAADRAVADASPGGPTSLTPRAGTLPQLTQAPRALPPTTAPTASGQTRTMVGTPEGLVTPGNIDLDTRPIVHNADGSVSSVRSITIGLDQGRAALIPTVSDDGRIMANQEAVQQFQRTGRHLGIFRDEASADAYARTSHAQMGPVSPAPSSSRPLEVKGATIKFDAKGNPSTSVSLGRPAGAAKADFTQAAGQKATKFLDTAIAAVDRLEKAGVLSDDWTGVAVNRIRLEAAIRAPGTDPQIRQDATFLLRNLRSSVPTLARGFGEQRTNQREEQALRDALSFDFVPASTVRDTLTNYRDMMASGKPSPEFQQNFPDTTANALRTRAMTPAQQLILQQSQPLQ